MSRIPADPFFLRAYSERGIRSELRVPIQLQGERVGFLFFCSRRPNVYGEEDVELARRIADHVALAIAHERLAEEGKRASQAQQRAVHLQQRVDALVEELEGVSPHRALGRSAAGLSKDARDRLLAHAWPGNVRELRNAIERAVILCEGGLVTGEHLPITVAGTVRSRGLGGRALAAGSGLPSAALPPQGVSLDAIERELIEKAMAQAN